MNDKKLEKILVILLTIVIVMGVLGLGGIV